MNMRAILNFVLVIMKLIIVLSLVVNGVEEVLQIVECNAANILPLPLCLGCNRYHQQGRYQILHRVFHCMVYLIFNKTGCKDTKKNTIVQIFLQKSLRLLHICQKSCNFAAQKVFETRETQNGNYLNRRWFYVKRKQSDFNW